MELGQLIVDRVYKAWVPPNTLDNPNYIFKLRSRNHQRTTISASQQLDIFGERYLTHGAFDHTWIFAEANKTEKEHLSQCAAAKEYVKFRDITTVITEFPSEGFCASPNKALISYLIDTTGDTGSKEIKSAGVAWNYTSYWYVESYSGKPEYYLEELKPLMPGTVHNETLILDGSIPDSINKRDGFAEQELVILMKGFEDAGWWCEGMNYYIGKKCIIRDILLDEVECPISIGMVDSDDKFSATSDHWWVPAEALSHWRKKKGIIPVERPEPLVESSKIEKGDRVLITGKGSKIAWCSDGSMEKTIGQYAIVMNDSFTCKGEYPNGTSFVWHYDEANLTLIAKKGTSPNCVKGSYIVGSDPYKSPKENIVHISIGKDAHKLTGSYDANDTIKIHKTFKIIDNPLEVKLIEVPLRKKDK